MAKKEKIEIHRDEDLTDIDNEFDRALDRLSGAEQNVRDLLETIDGQDEPQGEADAGESGVDGTEVGTTEADADSAEAPTEESASSDEVATAAGEGPE